MSEQRRGTHSIFRLHVVWCTKYRNEGVLKGDVGQRLKDVARKMCSELGVAILSGVVAKDPVHMLAPIPPQVSVSEPVQQVKGKSSYKLQREFAVLRERYRDQRMWARGYFARSTGNVADEMIESYIEGHTEIEDRFRVAGIGDFAELCSSCTCL